MIGVPLPRKDRLQALGLWPVWRLRTAAPVENVQPTSSEQTTSSEQMPAASPFVAALKSAALNGSTPSEGPQQVDTAPDIPPNTSLALPPEMDWPTLNAAIRACSRCELAKSRTQGVPGVGDLQADWLWIGDAPGAHEDRQGEPFMGEAGKLLDAMLAALGLSREKNVFITTLLKSRPPGNRDPSAAELTLCLPYLDRQIELLRPKVIFALGRFVGQTLLKCDTPIGTLRGQVHQYRGVPLVVTYHPSYLLHNPLDKAKAWEDMLLARATLNASQK